MLNPTSSLRNDTSRVKPIETIMRSNIPVFGNMLRISTLIAFLAFFSIAASPAVSVSPQPIFEECKLEGAGIGVNGSTVLVNGVTVTFSNWVEKQDSPGEYVGFDIDVPGLVYSIKANGEIYTGSGTSWMNPNGDSGSQASAISNIDFCANDGDPDDEAFCYLVADNDGFNSGSSDGITKLNEVFTEVELGLTGTDHIEAITFVSETGTLYGSDDKRFGSLDTTTGAFSYIGDFGSGDGAQGSINYNDIDGLAYDPFTKIMYASVRRGGNDDILIQVDIATGSGIDDAFGPGIDYVVVEKINNLEDVDDIAISSLDGKMYDIQNTAGNDSRLITINKATGATEDIGDLDVPNVEGLTFYWRDHSRFRPRHQRLERL